jgi:hypothetical protein
LEVLSYDLFRFRIILHTAYTVDACALSSILPSLSLIDIIYCTADAKATPASVQGVGVNFYFRMDFASPLRYESCTQPPIHWEPVAFSLGV